MGAKKNYYENLSHCKDWLIWTDPFTYRLIRLMGCEMPCGMNFLNRRTYIFNGDHSFSMTNSRYGMYNCSKFYSEEKLYKMLTSWCLKQSERWKEDGTSDIAIKHYFRSPSCLYDKLMALPRDYTQDEVRAICLNNDRHDEVDVAKIWGADLQPVKVGDDLMYLRLEGYKNNTGASSRDNIYCSEAVDSSSTIYFYKVDEWWVKRL